MAEYIDRELLKERFRKRLNWLKKDIHDEYSGALYDCCEYDTKLIDEIPVIDAVSVVRCLECKHYDPENHHCDHYMGTSAPLRRKPDDFCSYGERKEGAE